MAAAAAPNTRLLHTLLLSSLPSSFPDVLVKLLLSYHTNAMLLVDSSGSMYGTETKFNNSWRRLEQHFGDAASFSCVGFHHARIPGYMQMSDFLKSSGLTDLSIPLDQATEALKAGCCTLILFTDGANNAASEAAMYASMSRFYQAVLELDKCWQIRFHFITVGSWWCESTMNALSSLFGVAHKRVEVTVTDVDTFLSKGFNAPLQHTSLDDFKSIIALRAALPPAEREDITTMLHQFIVDQERREANGEGQEAKAAPKPPPRVFTRLHDFMKWVLEGDPPEPTPGSGVSVQMRALLNGVAPPPPLPAAAQAALNAAKKAKPKRKPELVQFLTNMLALNLLDVVPPNFSDKAALAQLDAGDYTDMLVPLVQVVGVSDGVAKKYSLKSSIQQNALKRFECVLAILKPGIPFNSFTQKVLDDLQARLVGVSPDMAQKTRINFLVVTLQLGLREQIQLAINIVAECWMIDPKPYSREQVALFSGHMLSDLRHVPQGERQTFSQGGELASNLAMLWCILGHAPATGQCGLKFGQTQHIQYWLGVTGMWARFATDTKCWDLYTMLQTKVDLKAYASLVVSLKGKYQQQLRLTNPALYFDRARAMLDKYVDAAQRAVAWTAETLPSQERDESMKVYTEAIHQQITQAFADRAAAEAKTASFANAAAVVAAAEAAAQGKAGVVAAVKEEPVVKEVEKAVVVHAQPSVPSTISEIDRAFDNDFPELGTTGPAKAPKLKIRTKAKAKKQTLVLAPQARPVSAQQLEAMQEEEVVRAPVKKQQVKKRATPETLKFVPPSGLAGTQLLCDEEAAAVLSLCGLLDIKALSDHAIALMQLLNRKPKDNTGDQHDIFRGLSKCLKFGPQQSVRGALDFISTSHPHVCRNLEEVKMTTTVINEFLTYVTTFEPLFELPPPTGWATPEWLELNRLTGINLETVPLNAATEHQAHIFKLAKDYREGMARLHSREFKFLTLPRLPDGSFSQRMCGCGAEILPHNEPGKARILPSPPPVRKPPPGMDPAEFARRPVPKPVGPPKVPAVVACLPDGPSPMHHLGEWTRFLLQEYTAAKEPLKAIEAKLATVKGPDSAEVGKPWGAKGSSSEWLVLNGQRVKLGEETKVFIIEKLLTKVLPTFHDEVGRPATEEVMWRKDYRAEVLKREAAIKKEFGLP